MQCRLDDSLPDDCGRSYHLLVPDSKRKKGSGIVNADILIISIIRIRIPPGCPIPARFAVVGCIWPAVQICKVRLS